MAFFYTNRAAVDYLTVTCWLPETYDTLLELMTLRDDPDKCEESKMMWYSGTRCNWENGSAFWGTGENNHKLHHIIQVSGAVSDSAAFALAHRERRYWKVSRFDVQITISLPEWYKSRALVETLRSDDWPHRSRKVTLIDGDGDDTVYVGSRYSERYIRIYVKEKDWLRFEIEYKGDLAEKAFDRYQKAPFIAGAGLLVSEIVRLPRHPVLQEYLNVLGKANQIDIQTAKPTKTPSKTFKWFRRQVYPALGRLLNDHDVGQQTRSLLEGLLQETEKAE